MDTRRVEGADPLSGHTGLVAQHDPIALPSRCACYRLVLVGVPPRSPVQVYIASAPRVSAHVFDLVQVSITVSLHCIPIPLVVQTCVV